MDAPDFDCVLEGGPFDGQTVPASQVIACGRESLVTIGDTTASYTLVPEEGFDRAPLCRFTFRRLIADPVSTRAIGRAEILCAESGFQYMSLRDAAESVGTLIFAGAALSESGDWQRARAFLARAIIYAETVHLRTPAVPVGGPLPITTTDEDARLARVRWAVKHDTPLGYGGRMDGGYYSAGLPVGDVAGSAWSSYRDTAPEPV